MKRNVRMTLSIGTAVILSLSIFIPMAQAAETSNPVNLAAPKEISSAYVLPFTGLKSAALGYCQ